MIVVPNYRDHLIEVNAVALIAARGPHVERGSRDRLLADGIAAGPSDTPNSHAIERAAVRLERYAKRRLKNAQGALHTFDDHAVGRYLALDAHGLVDRLA
jgi:hypothetical protein